MVKKRGRKPKNQTVVEEQNFDEGVPLEKKDDAFDDSEGILFTSAMCNMLLIHECVSLIIKCPKCGK